MKSKYIQTANAQNWISLIKLLKPWLKFDPLYLFVYSNKSKSFATLEKKIPMALEKISDEILKSSNLPLIHFHPGSRHACHK